jgi:hypothetical protein
MKWTRRNGWVCHRGQPGHGWDCDNRRRYAIGTSKLTESMIRVDCKTEDLTVEICRREKGV